jgi:hypothetical protein
MYEIVKYLSVDGKHRAVVSYDEMAQNPRDGDEWSDVSVWTYKQNSNYHKIPEGTSDLLELFEYQKEYIEEEVWTDFAEAVLNMKKINFMNVSINSGRDWVADCIFFGNDSDVSLKNVKAAVDEYQKFCHGEVYCVDLQQAVVYKSDDGKELIQWETIESSCGIYDDAFVYVQAFCTDYGVALDDKEVR